MPNPRVQKNPEELSALSMDFEKDHTPNTNVKMNATAIPENSFIDQAPAED